MAPPITPVFFVREGALVRPTGPREWTPLVRNGEAARQEVKRHVPPEGRVYVYDVDGVEAGAPNTDFHQRLERLHVPFWLHAGCRNVDDAVDAYFVGAEAITVEPRHMGPKELQELAEMEEGELHLALGFPSTRAQPDIRAFELQRMVQGSRAVGVVLASMGRTDVHALDAFAADLGRFSVRVARLDLEPTARLPPPSDASIREWLRAPEESPSR